MFFVPRSFMVPPFTRGDYKTWIEIFSREIARELLDVWAEIGKPKFIDRGNDAGAADFTSFTTDGSWHDLDLSSIVPSGAVAAVLRVQIKDDAAESILQFRKNGATSTYAIPGVMTQVANIMNEQVITVPCDEARAIEYKGTNTTFTSIEVDVIGWII